VLGHELRAAQYSYVWLSMWIDTLITLQKKLASHGEKVTIGTLEALSRSLEFAPAPLPSSMYDSDVPDNVRCFTTVQPHSKPGMNIKDLIIGGLEDLSPSPESLGWKYAVFDALLDPQSVLTAAKRGYLDNHFMLYGNDLSGKLSLTITIRQKGKITFCRPPGVWGKYPDDFEKQFNEFANIIMEPTVKSKSYLGLKQNPEIIKFKPPLKADDICFSSVNDITAGKYLMTMSTKSHKFITLSTILLP
jgi:hypothetical protein